MNEYVHGTLVETTGNDWNVLHVLRPSFIVPLGSALNVVSKYRYFVRQKINFDANISRWTRIVDELNEEKRFEN